MLQTEVPHVLRCRPDECDSRRLARAGKIGVFTEKSVSWMNPLSARPRGSQEDPLDLQIALCRLRWSHADCLARQADMRRVGIGFGIDRNRSNPHSVKGADDPAGYLAPVGYEYFGKHLNHREHRENGGRVKSMSHSALDLCAPC